MLEGLPPNGASTLLRFVSDASQARAVADFIVETFDPAETAACVFEDEKTGLWTAEVFFQDPPDEDELRALIESVFGDETAKAVSFSTIEERDWVENALAGLKPVRAGRILVHGAHDRARLRANDVGVEIEAALAFGTGHHGTTLGCLLALVEVLKRRRPRHALDVGTGTGVLAIACARLLHQPVDCGDIDAISVETARANALANGAGPYVRPLLATGVRHNALRGRRFDLILANILAKPLRLLAPSLAGVASPDAELILSGLLLRDVAGVLTAYRVQGFHLRRRRDIDGWATLLLSR
jgi:ribosomal protein L11 methyltransferase